MEAGMDRFDDHALELRCPDCRRAIFKTVAWLKLRRSLNCACCGTLIVIDQKNLLADVSKAEKAFVDLQKYFGGPNG